ncbi:low affinity immunoglobulin epsilon Fc receptor-like [Dreissena polymorpha]|uniref:C-type lectin domain-containing protein n=1 Tax=Dreissena polymorpha TaxID=45954 RepID=A0A9D4LGP6_DREPO|nr:low affinity immunoglobulin epsilon Fc receptor-like [Dreissena polymorpha]KAH3858352.1 hypothetical protein DPMN_100975 [Dreissena polymorpha]
MTYVVRITVTSLLMSMVCSSGLINVLDKKINGIKDAMESDIALLRHEMGNFSSQLAHLLHGTDGFSSKVQNFRQCGCEKAETGQTGDQFSFNQVIRKGFLSEKQLLKTEVERIQRNVNFTINNVDRMDRSLTSHNVNLIETKSHVKRINDITVDQSREILAIKGQMESFMTRKGFESEKKSLNNDVEKIHSYVNSTMNDFDRMNRSMASYKVDISESKSHVKRIDDITVIQSREILSMNQEMSSFMTKMDSLNETFKRRLEGVEGQISALYGFDARINKLDTDFNRRLEGVKRGDTSALSDCEARINKLEADFNRRLEGVKRDTSALPDFEARINKLEADFNKRSRFKALSASSLFGIHGKSIYVRPNNATDYNSATKFCSDIGGYLVEINSEEENAFIKQTFFTTRYTEIYLGGSDEITEGNWKWVYSGDRIPLRDQGGFQKWQAWEPNNAGQLEHCVMMRRFGEWNDVECNLKFAYVCERSLI